MKFKTSVRVVGLQSKVKAKLYPSLDKCGFLLYGLALQPLEFPVLWAAEVQRTEDIMDVAKTMQLSSNVVQGALQGSPLLISILQPCHLQEAHALLRHSHHNPTFSLLTKAVKRFQGSSLLGTATELHASQEELLTPMKVLEEHKRISLGQ